MRFDIVFTPEALEEQLSHEPNRETRNRKRLRPNQTAEWVIRVDRFRVFYDIEESANPASSFTERSTICENHSGIQAIPRDQRPIETRTAGERDSPVRRREGISLGWAR